MKIKDLLSEAKAAIPPKPRNFVAKNAKMGGAGQHADKKKAEKQGDVKHKKDLMPMEAGYRRDAYQRDYDHSVAGMGKRQSYAYDQDGGANDERHDLDPTDWYIVKDGKMFKTSVYPNQVQLAIAQGYSRTRDEAKAKVSEQGVAKGSKVKTAKGYGDVVQGTDVKTIAKADLGKNKLNLPKGYGDVVQPQKLKTIAKAKGVAEGFFSELDTEIDDMIGGYIAKYQDGLIDADHLGALIDKTAAKLAQKYNVEAGEMARHVSNHVADALGEE